MSTEVEPPVAAAATAPPASASASAAPSVSSTPSPMSTVNSPTPPATTAREHAASVATNKSERGRGGPVGHTPVPKAMSIKRTPPEVKRLVTPLVDLCVNIVAANFQGRPGFRDLPAQYVREITDRLPLDLPPQLAGTIVHEESYWKRRARADFGPLVRCRGVDGTSNGVISVSAGANGGSGSTGGASSSAGSWKQLWFEKNLEAALENLPADPSSSPASPTSAPASSSAAAASVRAAEEVRALAVASARWVRGLDLARLPPHANLSLVVLPHLTSLRVSYTVPHAGARAGDCAVSLSAAMSAGGLPALARLDLTSAGLDDDKAKVLCGGLAAAGRCPLRALVLAHNRLADRGARALGKLLAAGRPAIATLDLTHNHIHSEGGKALGRALRTNTTLETLILRLNRLEDEGGKAMLEALKSNTTLKVLHLGANGMGPGAGAALVAALEAARPPTHATSSRGGGRGDEAGGAGGAGLGVLEQLDMAGNEGMFVGGGEGDAVRELLEALEENRTLRSVDLRLCGLGEEVESAVAEIMRTTAEAGDSAYASIANIAQRPRRSA